MTLTSLVTGSASDYSMNVNVSDQDDYPYFSSGSALTGGVDGGLTPDAGTILVSVNGVTMNIPWQAGSNAPSIASQIAQQLEVASFLTVNYSSGETVGLTSTQPGSSTDWPITCSATDAYGQPVSFSVNCNGMSAGTNSAAATYQYSIPADGGYAANGSLLSVTDTVMGTWTYSYDSLNRLKTAQAVPNTQTGFAPYGAALLGWGYDSFGNYLGETLSGSTSFAMPQVSYTYAGHSYQNGALSGVVNNRIDGANYDAAGNVITDIAGNSYTYDAENRVLTAAGVTYMYDAEGNRVGKLSGAGLTEQYLLGLGGEQVTELDGSGNWQRTHVYGAGKELAKYDQNGVHFDFTDWLGTRRMQGGATGSLEETCRSLPYGDSLQCFGPDGQPNSDLSGHHLTGKERDLESGLDYFGARYYGSNMGRWMTPDWADKPEDVPYGNLEDPQSLNLYAYVSNNPLSRADADGHDPDPQAQAAALVPVLISTGEGAEGGAALGGPVGAALGAAGGLTLGALAAYATEYPGESPAPAIDRPGAMPGSATPTSSTAPPGANGATGATGAVPTSSSGGETAGEKFTPSDRAADAGRNCVYCGRPTTEQHGRSNSRETDHGHPRSRGGNREPKNRNPSCRTCNKQKGAKTPEEFKEWQKKNPHKVPKPVRFYPRLRRRCDLRTFA